MGLAVEPTAHMLLVRDLLQPDGVAVVE